MNHPLIPVLPLYVEGRAEFMEIMESLFQFYDGAEYPIRISGFGSWDRDTDSNDAEMMLGGVMFSVFEAPKREPIGSVRTTTPLPDVFEIVEELRDRLRKAGGIISHLEDDASSHVLTIRRPGIPDQTWEYGIDADDVQAILLFLQHDCTDIRRATRPA